MTAQLILNIQRTQFLAEIEAVCDDGAAVYDIDTRELIVSPND